MLERLRTATRDAHHALEQDLDLLSPPLRQARFAQILGGFHTFHADWEPRVAALLDDEALLAPRRRARLIEADLADLGAEPDDSPAFDLAYLDDPSAAWGSLYVVEGSALGGQLISRALRETSWAPSGGLRYFNPYGARTGEMWRGFRIALEAAAPSLDPDATAAGAQRTFETLRGGLVRRLRAAA